MIETEIDASDYAGPAELANAIRELLGPACRTYIWVKLDRSRHRVSYLTAQEVIHGLMIAADMKKDE